MMQRFQLHRLSLKLARIPSNIRPNTHRYQSVAASAMSSVDHSGLLPKDIHDIAAISKLSTLSPSEFSLISTSLLPWMVYRSGPHSDVRERLTDLFISRLTTPDDPLVSATLSVLDKPAMTPEAADLKHSILDDILIYLPIDQIEPFRGALGRMGTNPTEAEGLRLSLRSKHIVELLDATQAWVPRFKWDDVAIRSLELFVHTPEEMRPFVPELLEWLQDINWPPFSGCWAQLARFPEIVVDPIREVLRKGDEGDWANHLLRFLVEVSMPGQVRERARVEVERIAQRPTQSELENDAVETANDCLKKMDDWVDREKILSRKFFKSKV
ncbi:hypothetical protein C8R44DRAFT_768654 [Mycena epipterygia]|nr:hypothetical protein C8R44DRAFT_768654 [Mycena epipterygia]